MESNVVPFAGDEGEATPPRKTSKPRRWDINSMYWADHLKRPEGYMYEHMFVPKTVNLIAGTRNIGKTMLTMKMAYCMARGVPLGHVPIAHGRVLYLSQEMSQEEFRERLVGMLDASAVQQIADQFYIVCREPFTLDNDFGSKVLCDLINETNADVVFIDALRDVKGRAEENSNDQMAQVMLRLRDQVADAMGCAIVVTHHFGKPGQDGVERARGAIVIEDVASDVLYITRRDGKRVVTFEKVRHMAAPEPFSYTISSSDLDQTLVVDIKREQDEENELWRIHRLVEIVRAGGGSLPQSEVVAKSGVSNGTATRLLRAAGSAGFLGQKIEGNRVFWFVSNENVG